MTQRPFVYFEELGGIDSVEDTKIYEPSEYRHFLSSLIEKSFHLAGLDKIDRTLIELRVCGQWRYTEIAKEMGFRSKSSITHRMKRIDKKLKALRKMTQTAQKLLN